MEFAHPTQHEVIAVIRTAFDGVDRGDGVSLHEADVIDMYGSDQQRADARVLDTDRIWEHVSADDIRHFMSALSFLDPEGFRYYIPAFMVYTIEHHEDDPGLSISSTFSRLCELDKHDNFNVPRLKLMNDEQRHAIAMFLLYFSTEPYEGDRCRESLHRFWQPYLPQQYR